MARLSRKLRVCKWAGTLGCVLIVVAFAWSGWRTLTYVRTSNQRVSAVGLVGGSINFCIESRSLYPRAGSGWCLGSHAKPGWPLPSLAQFPSIISSVGGYLYIADLPLWLPFLVLLIPTLLLWRRDRRKPRPGFCRRCDYDLTGNTSGRCPECGTAITP